MARPLVYGGAIALGALLCRKLVRSLFTVRPKVVFVLGGPGAGKGTQCSKLVTEFGCVHLSAGDLLREERQSGSDNGELIEKYITEGKIVPVVITVNLLKKAIEKSTALGKYLFLIDGFPRNQENLDGWESVMGAGCDVAFTFFFNTSEAVMEARLVERGKTSGRTDDNVASIRKRFHTYQEETAPIIKMFAARGQAREIDTGRSIDAIYADVRAEFVKVAQSV